MSGGLASAAVTRLGRHALIYGAGAIVPFVAGMVNIAVLTRFIAPSAFGQLAVLLIFSASLTILYTLATLQGTFRLVFGGDGEEVADEEDLPVVSDKRRMLGTGIALTAAIGLLGTAAIATAAEPFTGLLFLERSQADLVVLAATGGALGAVWRVVSNIPRLERRPKTYAALSSVRPIAAVALSVTLVALGGGVSGVLVGIIAGTALAIAIGLIASRGSLSPAFRPAHAVAIMGAGKNLLPLILSIWIVHNVDVYIVAGLASDADAGLYRVASRVGAIVSFAVGFFMMAWMPLRRTSLFKAVEGNAVNGWFNAAMATYFVVVCIGLLVVLGVAAQLLVKIAGPAYADAASLIPLLGLGLVTYGCFTVLSRVVEVQARNRYYGTFAVVSAVVFLVVALLLTPPLGGHGAALGVVAGYAVGIGGMMLVASRSSGLPAIGWAKLGVSLGIGAACVAVAVVVAPVFGALEPAVDAAAILAYPTAILAAGVVDREHLAPLRRVVAGVLGPDGDDERLREGLAELPADDRALLERLLRDRHPPAEVARQLASVEPELHERFTGVLRRLAALPEGSERDAEIGAYLLSTAPVADRDGMARSLWEQDIEPAELHMLEATATSLAGERLWQARADRRRRARRARSAVH